jgi:hypothetical protein
MRETAQYPIETQQLQIWVKRFTREYTAEIPSSTFVPSLPSTVKKNGESSILRKTESRTKTSALASWAKTRIKLSHVGPPATTSRGCRGAAFCAVADPTTSCRPPLHILTHTGLATRPRRLRFPCPFNHPDRIGRQERVRWAGDEKTPSHPPPPPRPAFLRADCPGPPSLQSSPVSRAAMHLRPAGQLVTLF